MQTETQTGSRLKTNLEHLKRHVQYPANRTALVTACNNMSDATEADRTWFTSTLPEGNYKTPADVLNVLLTKV